MHQLLKRRIAHWRHLLLLIQHHNVKGYGYMYTWKSLKLRNIHRVYHHSWVDKPVDYLKRWLPVLDQWWTLMQSFAIHGVGWVSQVSHFCCYINVNRKGCCQWLCYASHFNSIRGFRNQILVISWFIAFSSILDNTILWLISYFYWIRSQLLYAHIFLLKANGRVN